MNLLCWNARGLGSTKKRNILHDLIIDHHIDIVAIQKTKK
jgi:exonuclease III